MNSINYDQGEDQILEKARELGVSEEGKRHEARRAILAEGRNAVPALIKVLAEGNKTARLEAAKALITIKDASAAPMLVQALKDEDHDVRWAAMTALIALGRDCLEPLLVALMKDFYSTWLREGAHHILNELKKKNELETPMQNVLHALEGIEPSYTVPWVAQAAWENLYGPNKKGMKSLKS